MPWVTDDELKEAVAPILRTMGSSLPAHWSALVTRENTRAYNRIRRVLADKGYTLASLDTWSERADFNLDGAICYILRKSKLADGSEGNGLMEFCKVWEELEKLDKLLSDDGEIFEPTASGNISFGSYDTGDDTFTRETVL